MLREDDDAVTAQAMNLRLSSAGVLDGAPGAWTPTVLASVLGVRSGLRTAAGRDSYTAIVFDHLAQQTLRALYEKGRI